MSWFPTWIGVADLVTKLRRFLRHRGRSGDEADELIQEAFLRQCRMGSMSGVCANCGTQLIGQYCHACGQRRLGSRLTLSRFAGEVARRVFRFDKALVVTLFRMLRAPGRLVSDYLEGRRTNVLDPLQFFVSSAFVRIVVAALVRSVAPLMHRESALTWLSLIGLLLPPMPAS